MDPNTFKESFKVGADQLVDAVFAPLLAAVGAIAAVVTDCTIEVERTMHPDDKAPPV